MIVCKYKKIIEDFLSRKASADEFQTSYFQMFKEANNKINKNIFKILNDVFESADCYWHECQPGEETSFEISEGQLRKEVAEALKKLNEIGT
ncbi:colicin immunity domain-containing protein [Gottfriedia acidiceleris]|uniref:colicin immunity domain-containing protein n=1 Tax=Gottfriedia acidiceleris TaxID=371036 RepID=UPI000B4528DB|nr:colicin immunity domain-containing protein [Gottfriedia acidiceleris]